MTNSTWATVVPGRILGVKDAFISHRSPQAFEVARRATVGHPQDHVLGWQVPNIAVIVKSLQSAGVTLERYRGIPQDSLGIWTSPSGAKVAWFKDPDGNTLSVTQF